MGIFAKLDAASIPTNPFFIEKGEYDAEVTNAQFKDNRDGERQLFLEYTIDDETSQYNGSRAQHYFDLPDPEMTSETLALLPPDEQKNIRRSISSMKKTLCGNGRNKGLGVSADDLNEDEWSPEVLKGLKVNLAISNYGTDGVNVQWVNLREE